MPSYVPSGVTEPTGFYSPALHAGRPLAFIAVSSAESVAGWACAVMPQASNAAPNRPRERVAIMGAPWHIMVEVDQAPLAVSSFKTPRRTWSSSMLSNNARKLPSPKP